MKLDLSKTGTIVAAALVLLVIPFSAKADQWNKKTIVTVNEPIQVTNTYLEPGTYVFKLADSSSDRHIVQIFNRNENHLIDTVLAIPDYRTDRQLTSRVQFTFWETPPGTVRAMKAWFYPGDNFGQEFRYPTDLKLVAAVENQPATLTPTPTPAAVTTTPPAVVPPQADESSVEQPAAEPAPQAETQPQTEEQAQEPEQLAQNNPPPAAQPEPEQQAPATPQELPHTASPYPLIGLAGMLSAGLGLVLRVKRVS